jgi:hypothetical protein
MKAGSHLSATNMRRGITKTTLKTTNHALKRVKGMIMDKLHEDEPLIQKIINQQNIDEADSLVQ